MTPPLTARHIACGDVLDMHAQPEYRDCLFQVASQFNCLEMVGPDVTPENGALLHARTHAPHAATHRHHHHHHTRAHRPSPPTLQAHAVR